MALEGWFGFLLCIYPDFGDGFEYSTRLYDFGKGLTRTGCNSPDRGITILKVELKITSHQKATANIRFEMNDRSTYKTCKKLPIIIEVLCEWKMTCPKKISKSLILIRFCWGCEQSNLAPQLISTRTCIFRDHITTHSASPQK